MNIFGFDISRNRDKKALSSEPRVFSPIPKVSDDGEIVVSAGGFQGQYLANVGETFSGLSEAELITNYRTAAENPELDAAISDIVDEAISLGSGQVSIDLDGVDSIDDSVKKKITSEFHRVSELLDFNAEGADVFRKWYVDGRVYYHLIKSENSKEGIAEMRMLDPMKIRKIREVRPIRDEKLGVTVEETVDEYFIYSDSFAPAASTVMTVTTGTSISGLKLTADSIVYVPSGVTDHTRRIVTSHLQKALKPLNQLRMMEDSLVIYRITRAPERRIFYIDVGNLPKGKAEEYVQSIMNKYRNKPVYDASTGIVRDDRRHMSMLEDFWLPRREGGRGTEITTLPGGENLSQLEDVLFFRQNLYKALNVPISRLQQDATFSLGRATEIARDEVKFQKFIDKLRTKFSQLFLDALRVQLLLKNIITEDDWKTIASSAIVVFPRDNFFAELKDAEILRERLNTLSSVDAYIGKYYSAQWVRRNVLKQTDEDIKRIDEEIASEAPPEPVAPPVSDDGTSPEDPTKLDSIDDVNLLKDVENGSIPTS